MQITQYEFARNLYKQASGLSAAQLTEKTKNIGLWFSSNQYWRYFMLLCAEKRDYTIFDIEKHNYNKARSALIDCINGRGKCVAIDYNHDDNYYEIWIKNDFTNLTGERDTEANMYILFPCNNFIVQA